MLASFKVFGQWQFHAREVTNFSISLEQDSHGNHNSSNNVVKNTIKSLL